MDAALARYDSNLRPREDRIRAAAAEARGIKDVLSLYVETGHAAVKKDEKLKHGTNETLTNDWFGGRYPYPFLFDRLDEINIKEYFDERVEF